jgi:hypothetical protein
VDVISGPHQTRISSETGVSVDTLQAQKSAAGLGYGDLEMAKASGQSFNDIVAKFKAGRAGVKLRTTWGLNLGKIVSDAHRSHSGQGKVEVIKPSIIPGPGIPENSILYTGITPIPSATVGRGVNPVPSATISPRP